MEALQVSSGTTLKASLTVLLWISVFIIIQNYITNLKKIYLQFNRTSFYLINILIVFNIFHIIRGLLDTNIPLTTTLGNPYNTLALLTPLAVSFSVRKNNIYLLNKFLIKIMILGDLLILISFMMEGTLIVNKPNAAWQFMHTTIFLIGITSYLAYYLRYFILLNNIFLLWYIGIIITSRATILRVLLFYLFNILSRRFQYQVKILYPAIIIFVILTPLFLINTSLSGDSILGLIKDYVQESFGSSSTSSSFVVEKADTRTFMYIEVIEDLVNTDSLLFGRGSSGTYYSQYFYTTGADANNRFTTEVGFLSHLLKGGIATTLITLLLFLNASYLAIYQSKSIYIKWIGFIIITHIFVLSFENLVSFNLYNICIWFFVGICFSKDIRLMEEKKIAYLFKPLKVSEKITNA